MSSTLLRLVWVGAIVGVCGAGIVYFGDAGLGLTVIGVGTLIAVLASNLHYHLYGGDD